MTRGGRGARHSVELNPELRYRWKGMKRMQMVGVAGLVAILAMSSFGAAAQKKLIATGWDSPTPAQFRQNLATFEKCPFDGTTIMTTRKLADGHVVNTMGAFSREVWHASEFEQTIADLKAAHPVKARDNFLMLNTNPGNVDWFDDAGWKQVVDHWRLIARAAKQGGMRGILYDPEPYTPPYCQFSYHAQAGSAKHTFAEYEAKVRQRGQEVMRAVAFEYPRITIYAYFLLSVLPGAQGKMQDVLASDGYGLIPAFVNGWLDVAPSGVNIIDGNEGAYTYNSVAQFDRAYTRMHAECNRMLAPDNRERFRVHYTASHGIYLDAYANPPSSPYYIDPLGGTRAARLLANVKAALGAADEYVWVYGEKGRWWPNGSQEYPLWPDKLPGADTALQQAKDPLAAAKDRLNSMKPSDNLLQNAGFSKRNGDRPDAWWFWQQDGSHGTPSWSGDVGAAVKGSACVRACGDGCFGQNVKVQPGADYVVRLKSKTKGRGQAGLLVCWQNTKGAWTAPDENQQVSADPGESGGWRQWTGIVHVPDSATALVFMPTAKGGTGPDDTIWFDDAVLVKLELVP